MSWCDFQKQEKDQYDKDFQTLKKKQIEEYIRKWKELQCSWVSRTNIVKMVILPIAIYTLNRILIKTPRQFFTNLEIKFLNNMENQESQDT